MALRAETIEQIKIFNWIRAQPRLKKCSFSIPNDAKRSLSLGSLMRRMGLLAGVSDFFIAMPAGKYHGLFIELKAKNKDGVYGKPTVLQQQFIETVLENGYMASVCNGADEAINLIKTYLAS